MRVIYFLDNSVDCTADPHPVGGYELQWEVMEDIIRVCESSLVEAIEAVSATVDGVEYSSDIYENSYFGEAAEGPFAEKHKVAGLAFAHDADVPARRHLPPGLSGLRALREMLRRGGQLEGLRAYVLWEFAPDSSCSDFIEYDIENPLVVNYSSQDWWMTSEGYEEWAQAMANLLQRDFPYEETSKIAVPEGQDEA